MNNTTSNILFYSGLIFLTIGAYGLTFAVFFAVIGLPIFIVGIILVLISRKSWKQRLLPICLFIIGVIAYWPIFKEVNTVGPETFLIPDDYRGKVNIIYKTNCGITLEETKEGLIYKIPKDGILIINGEQNYGFINHNYYRVDQNGHRIELPKMDVRDFNEEWTLERNPKEPPRDKLGVFHWGRTGSSGIVVNENGIQNNPDEQYTFKEFYVSTYNNLSERFNFKYEQEFDSIRNRRVKNCN